LPPISNKQKSEKSNITGSVGGAPFTDNEGETVTEDENVINNTNWMTNNPDLRNKLIKESFMIT
jgi:hypothetical protein